MELSKIIWYLLHKKTKHANFRYNNAALVNNGAQFESCPVIHLCNDINSALVPCTMPYSVPINNLANKMTIFL